MVIVVESVQAFLADDPPLEEVRFVCFCPGDAKAYYEEFQRRVIPFEDPD